MPRAVNRSALFSFASLRRSLPRRIALALAIVCFSLMACYCGGVSERRAPNEVNFNDPQDIYGKFLRTGKHAGDAFRGKEVELSGTVHLSSFTMQEKLFLILATDTKKLQVTFFYHPSRKDEILALKKGMPIQALGRVDKVLAHADEDVVAIDLDGTELFYYKSPGK
ncbi:unnamed protein product [uncultured bacterium]|nr:unnamed protein product [uncultured bacterium]